MSECLIPKAGNSTDIDAITALSGDVLINKAFINKDGEISNGTMPHLTNETPIMHQTTNPTRVFKTDECYVSDNTDGIRRLQLRYNEKSGYITGNTLFGLEIAKAVAGIGLVSWMLRAGVNVLGVPGDAWVVGTGDVNAEDRFVLASKTYWKEGTKRTGTLPTQYCVQEVPVAAGAENTQQETVVTMEEMDIADGICKLILGLKAQGKGKPQEHLVKHPILCRWWRGHCF